MALRWYCGFDFLTTADLSVLGMFDPQGLSVVAGGRASTNYLRGNAMSPGYIDLPDTQATLIVGFAFKTPNYNFSGRVLGIHRHSVGEQVFFTTTPGGYPTVKVGSTTLGTGTIQIPLNSWVYIEMKVTCGTSSNGSVQVKVNSVTDIDVSSVTTGTASAADALIIGGGGAFNSFLALFDDIYLCDGTGSSPYNDFLGDVSVQAVFADGVGNSTQFSRGGSDSGTNWGQVDESTPNSDTDYVYSSTVGNKDLYTFGSIAATTGTIYAVQPRLFSRKDDAGARSICSVARVSGTEADSSNASIGETYVYYSDIRTTKPGGGSWAISDVNGAEFGIKVTV